MADAFNPPSPKAAVSLPDAGTVAARTAEMEWQESAAKGFWMKPLLDDGDGRRTFLSRIDAGAHAETHTHEDIEEIYVIEGSFYDQDREYEAGDFLVRAPGTEHSAGSRTGAVVLVSYFSTR